MQSHNLTLSKVLLNTLFHSYSLVENEINYEETLTVSNKTSLYERKQKQRTNLLQYTGEDLDFSISESKVLPEYYTQKSEINPKS